MSKIFVSIINFNSAKATIDCLESIEKAEIKNLSLSIVIVDNSTSERLVLDKKYKNFDYKILRSQKNLGFSGGQNLGIKFALENNAEYVLVLNNDTFISEGLIGELLNSFDKNVGIVSPKIYFEKGHEFHKGRYKESELGNIIWFAGGKMDWKNLIASHRGVDEVDQGQYDNLQETDFATGCCMMIDRKVFEKVGFFDEKYFLYFEDNDFSQRARKMGFKIIYQPRAKLWHKNAASAGGSGSDLQDYYITRNRLLFGIKFADLKVKSALLNECVRLLIRGRKWQKKGVLDFFLGKFEKGSYPI